MIDLRREEAEGQGPGMGGKDAKPSKMFPTSGADTLVGEEGIIQVIMMHLTHVK